MKYLAIIGAGALGQQIAQHVTQCRAYTVTGFFDDILPIGASTPYGLVLGPVSAVHASYARGMFDEVLLGIGYKHLARRQQIYDELALTIPFGRFVHPSSYIDSSAYLGPGTFVSPGCVVELNARIEANAFIYTGCLVTHDGVIGSHTFLAPGVRLAGRAQIGMRCFLGIGTTVIENCTLANDVRTGASTTVLESLSSGIYIGSPARLLPSASLGYK